VEHGIDRYHRFGVLVEDRKWKPPDKGASLHFMGDNVHLRLPLDAFETGLN
jgi:hypothetical protein